MLEFDIIATIEATQCLQKNTYLEILVVGNAQSKILTRRNEKVERNAFTHADKNFARSLL